MTNPTFVQADLADGTIERVTALRVIDGVPGWAEAVNADGQIWAYAPQWYAVAYGEIARQIA